MLLRRSTTEGCEAHDVDDDITTEKLDHLARCTYIRKGPIRCMPFRSRIQGVRQACSELTGEKLSLCFYRIIKTLQEYPGVLELYSITGSMSYFDFTTVPPGLAFLVIDAMRTVHGKDILSDYDNLAQVAFVNRLPWKDYKGDKGLPVNCQNAKDEDILGKWEWLAACRYKRNGEIVQPA